MQFEKRQIMKRFTVVFFIGLISVFGITTFFYAKRKKADEYKDNMMREMRKFTTLYNKTVYGDEDPY